MPEEVNDRLVMEARWAARKEILSLACGRLSLFDVPFFLWKGVDFAFSLYEDPVDRPMSDIDILVPVNFAGMASSVLVSGGFRRYSPGSGMFTSGIIGETKFTRGGYLLELHTHPLYHPLSLPGKIPGLKGMKVARCSGGYPALSWTDTFLYTLLHHSDSPDLSPWQRKDIELLCGKIREKEWADLACLCIRTGWAGRIARVISKCRGRAPSEFMEALLSVPSEDASAQRRGTLHAMKVMNGWQGIAFAAAVFYRALTGRGSGRED